MINLRKKLGQSTIESAVLGTLILGAISYMVTYVAGSWNAHIKNYEETIRESETEQYTKGPPGTFNRGPCRIGNLIPSNPPICGSGGAPCGSNPLCTTVCPVGTRLAQRSCINCAPTECRQNECLPYNGCCSQWRPNCTLPGSVSCCGVNANCPDGQAWSWRICGGNTQWGCVGNAHCEFQCQGNQTANATICHFGTPQADNIRLPNRNIPHILKPSCSVPHDAIKCESTCDQGWIYRGGSPPDCIGCEPTYVNRARYAFCGHDCRGTCDGSSLANAAHRAVITPPPISNCQGNNRNPWWPVIAWCSPNHIAVTGNCEITAGTGCWGWYTQDKWQGIRPLCGTRVTSGQGSGQISGWRCQTCCGGPNYRGCGGNNCGTTNWFTARVTCVPKPLQCPRPTLYCRALSTEPNLPFRSCFSNEFILAQYCSGDCGNLHARTRICCDANMIPPSQRPRCRAIPTLVTVAAPNCNANETKWLEYETGVRDQFHDTWDSRITFCCETARMPPVGRCDITSGFRGTIGTGAPGEQWPPQCAQGRYSPIQPWCTGRCEPHDSKTRICCDAPTL